MNNEWFLKVYEVDPGTLRRAEGNLEVRGDVQSNTSRLGAVYGHSLIINPHPRDVSGSPSIWCNDY